MPQLKGLKTQGLNGTFEPMAAFKTLLDGTALLLREEGGAFLITQAAPPSQRGPAQSSGEPRIEVEIRAQYEKLSVMRAELVKLEDQFYAEYNKLNTDRQYDVVCRMEAYTGSHLLSRVCEPAFVAGAEREETRAALQGHAVPLAILTIQEKTPGYQKNMATLVEKHPELFRLVKERSELAQRYEAVRKQKIHGQTIDWD